MMVGSDEDQEDLIREHRHSRSESDAQHWPNKTCSYESQCATSMTEVDWKREELQGKG
jgi:hypothetical protein